MLRDLAASDGSVPDVVPDIVDHPPTTVIGFLSLLVIALMTGIYLLIKAATDRQNKVDGDVVEVSREVAKVGNQVDNMAGQFSRLAATVVIAGVLLAGVMWERWRK